MLVSTVVDSRLRQEVIARRRPCPEYLKLEQTGRVELLDWSQLGGRPGGRTATRSLRHALTAIARNDGRTGILSDGEHLGIPLALALRLRRRTIPHVMIGHHLTTRSKALFFRRLHAERQITRILVHTRQQLAGATSLGIPPAKLRLVPYGVDTAFWHPWASMNGGFVLVPGREHRDFSTLAAAVAGLSTRVLVTGASAHSPKARAAFPASWPRNVERGAFDYLELRRRYAAATVVVIPLTDTDFPAGITAVLEAMAMGKAVIATATTGLDGVVSDGETGVLVPPGDPMALREAIQSLHHDATRRDELGRMARQAVERDFGLETYAERLLQELDGASE